MNYFDKKNHKDSSIGKEFIQLYFITDLYKLKNDFIDWLDLSSFFLYI